MKLRYTGLLVAVVGVAMLADPASAGTKAGSMELSLFGSGSSSWVVDSNEEGDGSTVETVLGGGSLSYFIADWFSIGGAGTVIGGSSEGNWVTVTFISVRPDFYLGGSSEVVPYVGLDIGGGSVFYSSDDGSESDGYSGFLFGGHAGLKFFVSENASIDLEGQLRGFTMESNEGETSDEETLPTLMTASLNLGVSIYW